VDVSGRVRMKSDRRTRALVLALCIAPVAAPILAAGINNLLKSPAAPVSTQAQTPESAPGLRPSLQPPLRATIDGRFLSPKPMSSDERLVEQKPAAKPQQMIARPRVNGAQVLREVNIIDGLHIAADGVVIALGGIASVPAGSECRRLDGVVEACAVRAASRLEVLTRGRPVVCDVKESDGGELRGVCRAGKIDLADDLVRNGLAVRTSDGR
jgi:endonuclease YncB( thermonuclease family)